MKAFRTARVYHGLGLHYMAPMRFHQITFGCQMNVADARWLARALTARGWTETADAAKADVALVNTCSVRDKPEQKVYSQLGRLAEQLRPEAFVAVGGCVAQQIGAGFWNRFPQVRLVYGTDGVAMVPQTLDRLVESPKLRVSLLDFADEYLERDQDGGDATVAPTAFVNIMQGCDNFCAYCIVPFVRGRQKSRHADAVLDECRMLLDRGAKEITLLGQNVNSYGHDLDSEAETFAELLRLVAALPGLERLRFTTSHPKDIDPRVVAAFGELDAMMPHLHLPMQSGSDAVLKRMGRKYDRARYMAVVRELRAARPDIALTTDLIVGFPGETEADFRETLSAMDEAGFSSSFSFKYSDRPGTRAETMPDKVPDEVAAERLETLQAKQLAMTGADLTAQVGRTPDVLIEEPSRIQRGGAVSWRGREPGGRAVNVQTKAEGDLTGTMARVRITVAKKHSLFGEMEGEPR